MCAPMSCGAHCAYLAAVIQGQRPLDHGRTLRQESAQRTSAASLTLPHHRANLPGRSHPERGDHDVLAVTGVASDDGTATRIRSVAQRLGSAALAAETRSSPGPLAEHLRGEGHRQAVYVERLQSRDGL